MLLSEQLHGIGASRLDQKTGDKPVTGTAANASPQEEGPTPSRPRSGASGRGPTGSSSRCVVSPCIEVPGHGLAYIRGILTEHRRLAQSKLASRSGGASLSGPTRRVDSRLHGWFPGAALSDLPYPPLRPREIGRRTGGSTSLQASFSRRWRVIDLGPALAKRVPGDGFQVAL
jgi:hypothetical protein